MPFRRPAPTGSSGACATSPRDGTCSDVIKWSKFSGASWLKDGSGFFYSRYAAPAEGQAFSGVNKHQQVFFHALGAPQEQDTLVFARDDQPDWGFNADVTEDGRFLTVVQWEGTNRENRIFLRDLTKPGSTIEPFLDKFDASYKIVGNDGDRFYVLTDNAANRYRLVAIDRGHADPATWTTIIPEPEGRDVLAGATMIGERFIVQVRTDAHERLVVFKKDGAREREIELPALGSIGGVSARRRDTEAFYAFTSFTHPTTIYQYNPASGESRVFKRPTVKFSPSEYEVTQVFYPSKDGTQIPMFLVGRKGLARDGHAPTLLYGYGGFDISLTPAFSPAIIGWLEMGGLYAQPNLRGGGEYGKAWHDAGRLANKQNVFDDFIAAAEYLIRERYTSTPKLAINGGSNGGLLVGAAMTQRPDLFGAAIAQVGVMDMLRFHKFTIGWAWTSDYGSSETKSGFDTLIKYSPLHNIKSGNEVSRHARDDRRPRRPRRPGAQPQVHRDVAGGTGRRCARPDAYRDACRTRRRQADHETDRRARGHLHVPVVRAGHARGPRDGLALVATVAVRTPERYSRSTIRTCCWK